MFSSGNTTERQRAGTLVDGKSEVIVDLFAGIGYFTLPFLVKGGALKVIACDWNADAHQALQTSLEKNKVADRWVGVSNPAYYAAAALSVHGKLRLTAATTVSCFLLHRCEQRLGDCREVAPAGVADRVNLGLIPTSEFAWETAIKCLKPLQGGWLHIHENVHEKQEEEWKQYVISKLHTVHVAGNASVR